MERAAEMCGIHHHLVMVVVEMMIFAERGTMERIEVETGSERKAESWWKLKREKNKPSWKMKKKANIFLEEEDCPQVGDFSKVLREKWSCKEKELEQGNLELKKKQRRGLPVLSSALLPTVKVRSHSHFVYLFVIMRCF